MVSTAPESLAPAGLEGKKVLERLLLPELKQVARELGLKVGGTTAAILQRIVDYATIFVVYDVTLTDLKLFVFEPNDDLGREEKLVFDPDQRKALWATSLRDAVGGLEDTDCVLPLDEELNAVERDVLAETLRRMGEDDLSRTLLGDENEASAPNAVTGGTGAAPTPLLLRLPLMAGLAVQYGLQTYFQHRYLSKRVNKLGLVFCCEVVKLAIASAALAVEALRGGERAEIFSRKTARSVMLCSLPALIYVIQNLCVQTAYSELDSITFNCLNQTKLITTAAALFAIKGVRQSARQMVALGLVSGGAMLLAVRDSGGQRAAAGAGEATAKGVAMILAAAGLSGVAATLTQIFMQDMRLSPFLVTVSMCMVSIATVGGSILSQVRREDRRHNGPPERSDPSLTPHPPLTTDVC